MYTLTFANPPQYSRGIREKFIYQTKFVLLTANKKFACETKEQAEESFKQRKLGQIRILNEQLKRAKEDLSLVQIQEDIKDLF